MGEREPGPSVIWLVRHGESMGNVADAQAQKSGAGRLKLDVRDPDVELSDIGAVAVDAARHVHDRSQLPLAALPVVLGLMRGRLPVVTEPTAATRPVVPVLPEPKPVSARTAAVLQARRDAAHRRSARRHRSLKSLPPGQPSRRGTG